VQWRKWLRVIQAILTVVLVVWLLKGVDWAKFGPLAANLSWSFISLSTICVLGSHILNIMRWQHLLRPAVINYSRLLQYYGAGLFANNFLPTGIGGDGIRIALLSRDVTLSQAIFSVGLDRLLGLCGLTALILPALWLGLPPGLQIADNIFHAFVDRQNLLAISLLVGAIVILSALSIWRCSLRVRAATIRFIKHFQGSYNVPRWTRSRGLLLLGGAYGLSVGSQLMLVAAHWAILHALNIVIVPGSAIWLVLIISLSMFVPITVNGLGIQEGLYVILLGHYGVPATAALGVAVLIRLLMLFYSLLGGVLSLGSNLLGGYKLFVDRAPHDVEADSIATDIGSASR
jgi:glycosyltransferase 2 family protein